MHQQRTAKDLGSLDESERIASIEISSSREARIEGRLFTRLIALQQEVASTREIRGRFPSPLSGVRFTRDDERVHYHAQLEDMKASIVEGADPPAMEATGPREKLFFDPSRLACEIVTCGGLCPGPNDVNRSIVLSPYHHYGANKVHGFRFGYEGLAHRYGHQALKLAPESPRRSSPVVN